MCTFWIPNKKYSYKAKILLIYLFNMGRLSDNLKWKLFYIWSQIMNWIKQPVEPTWILISEIRIKKKQLCVVYVRVTECIEGHKRPWNKSELQREQSKSSETKTKQKQQDWLQGSLEG